jgi:IclR family transcriptional regulator, acetate operon repressor
MTQSATQRCLDILEFLVKHPRGLGLTEICEDLRIPKSVAHRLLALLTERGFVRQDGDNARYGLTLKLTLLGARYYVGTGLSDVGQPILDRLAGETGELARLSLVEGQGLVWVAKAQGARYGLKYDPDTGMHVVLHATATGKVWLSTLPEEEAIRIIVATGFDTPAHFGPNVIRDIDRFRKELRLTRKRGYGLALEEGEPGTAAVAVAVRASSDPDAPSVGTLSLAGPVTRFTAARRQEFAERLVDAAASLSMLWPIRTPQNAGQRRDETQKDTNRSRAGGVVHAVR